MSIPLRVCLPHFMLFFRLPQESKPFVLLILSQCICAPILWSSSSSFLLVLKYFSYSYFHYSSLLLNLLAQLVTESCYVYMYIFFTGLCALIVTFQFRCLSISEKSLLAWKPNGHKRTVFLHIYIYIYIQLYIVRYKCHFASKCMYAVAFRLLSSYISCTLALSLSFSHVNIYNNISFLLCPFWRTAFVDNFKADINEQRAQYAYFAHTLYARSVASRSVIH